MNNIKEKNFKIAFGGITSALSLTIMFLTGLIPTLTYAMPAVSGALLMMLVIEINPKFAGAVYLSVSILSLLIVADKEAAVMYAIFFGYYPIIKGFIEKKTNTVVSWIIKYAIFNIAVICSYFIVTRILGIGFDDMGLFGKYAMPALLAMANIVFAIYDIALTRIITAYLISWQKYVKRMFK